MAFDFGGVGEWLKPAVLKTVRPQKGLVGSNPTPSASQSPVFSAFQHGEYVGVLEKYGMVPSMSRPANPYDNASCESGRM
jgi:transposase InsO family protein